jgi:regulator of RNase E activity RraA
MPLTLAQSDLSTCEISDTIIKLGVPHGSHIPDIHRISPHSHSRTNGSAGRCLCGPAYTVRMVLASERDAPKLQGAHFVNLAPEGGVVFVSAPPGWSPVLSTLPVVPTSRPPSVPALLHSTSHQIDLVLNVKQKKLTLSLVLIPLRLCTGAQNAVWGGLMTAGAQAHRVLSAVVSSRMRDVSEHHAAGFMLFARRMLTVGQASFTCVAEVQVPVMTNVNSEQHGGLAAVTVNPSDLLVVDDDGVVCTPKLLEEEVLRMASRGREIDVRCLRDIQSGVGVTESFRHHWGKL